jgi:ubiquinone/menaquinone biosynthesis C-methylase UbiE
MTFTREEYLKDYTLIYTSSDEGGSGGAEYKRSQEYYDLPKRGGFKDGMSLLDYGCGWGAMCAGLEVEDYYGCDIIEHAINLAKKHFPNKTFEVLEIGKLNIKPKDFCIALSVFTHCLFEDVDDCLDDITRNTIKGALIDILEGDKDKSDIHIRYWDREGFIKKLEEHGFKVKGEFSITAQYGYVHTYFILEK